LAARQSVPALPAGWVHATEDPSHTSRVQALPSSAHAVFAAAFASPGHAVDPATHVSATSHTPAEARHVTAPGFASGVHVPSFVPPRATLHAWQSVVTPPPHAVSQQTPSTQNAPPSQSPWTAHAMLLVRKCTPRASPLVPPYSQRECGQVGLEAGS
jgi:hypothetical protein